MEIVLSEDVMNSIQDIVEDVASGNIYPWAATNLIAKLVEYSLNNGTGA